MSRQTQPQQTRIMQRAHLSLWGLKAVRVGKIANVNAGMLEVSTSWIRASQSATPASYDKISANETLKSLEKLEMSLAEQQKGTIWMCNSGFHIQMTRNLAAIAGILNQRLLVLYLLTMKVLIP